MDGLILGSCGCAVTVHQPACPHHVHVWSKDYYYDDQPSDRLVYCMPCGKSRWQLREEELAARAHAEQARLGANDGYA